MSLDPGQLASVVSEETGLEFGSSAGTDADGQRWILLTPEGADARYTFGIRVTVGWRRLEISFEPGKFAADLVRSMSETDEDGRAGFAATLHACERAGADIQLVLNGKAQTVGDTGLWDEDWRRLELVLRKGQLEIGDDDARPDIDIVGEWTVRFAAAVLAILPVETGGEPVTDNQAGFPEGARTVVTVNRYERDRRNRAAAIAIHGTRCHGCGMDFGEAYGEIAAGFIEIHHTVPVSRMGNGYVINPERDLVPLCPNCHAVAHRRDPPLSVDELRIIRSSRQA